MDERSFWQRKLIQFFHDPPHKPFASYPKSGGHANIAKKLFEHFTQLPLRYYNRHPDWAAAGADCPLLAQPKAKGIAQVQLSWPKRPLLTHPLCRARIEVDIGATLSLSPRESGAELLEDVLTALAVLHPEGSEEVAWQDGATLRRDFARLWRRFRDELIAADPANRLLWEELPADGRSPDHSIWDHLRVATALAFLPDLRGKRRRRQPDDPQSPWLLRFSLHPVQHFIAEARTSRDLWVGSFLLADLAWHGMQPVVDRYGHDAILYPDLRGNPMVDNWLAAPGGDPERLPEDARKRVSFASLLPANFTAVVPYGGADSYLLPLSELAQECSEAVQQRWQELADQVAGWLEKKVGPGTWREIIWQRQHQQVMGSAWSAVAWLPPEPLNGEKSLLGRALPAQSPDFRRDVDEADQNAMAERHARLAPWVPPDTWQHYQRARQVYALTHLHYHQMERGFDYALIHHQLSARHALRCAQVPVAGGITEEPGEKCTCCGRRQALSNHCSGHIGGDRERAKDFWRHEALDPDKSGNERLCAVCAMKRFLIVSGWDSENQRMTGINPVWAGHDQTEQNDALDRDHKPRVPFPSTATVAAQRFIEAVITTPALQSDLAAVVRAHQAAGLSATSFPRALPRLAAVGHAHGTTARRFLEREAEEVLFPEALLGMRRGEQARQQQDRQHQARDLKPLIKSVQQLRKSANKQGLGAPNTRVAVLRMDGDRIGQLLLGDREVINARWRDVIHPYAIEQMESTDTPRTHSHEADWLALLDAKRLTGPSLHAYISRALAAFSHRIVPWVVEQEFGGRLIYAGGDELLCLVPGDEALGLAGRLQQLFCAPWIIDTEPESQHDLWSWRRHDWRGDYDQHQARQRFAIPRYPQDQAVALPITEIQALVPYPDCDMAHRYPELPVHGAVIPLLGEGQSLSAGIAYGHYKTPLRQLLERAQQMLEEEAKAEAGRAAVAMSYASRGGVKHEFAMPWREAAQKQLSRVIDGFKDGRLPSRLPYKLREIGASAAGVMAQITDADERERWLHNLFAHALDSATVDPDTREAAVRIWQRGLRRYASEPERAAGGLLLCRALASAEGEQA